MDFDLSIDDIVIPKICPLLNIPINKVGGKVTSNSPSLDRINPMLGYVKGNVWVISYKANAVKSNCSIVELEMIVMNLRNAVA